MSKYSYCQFCHRSIDACYGQCPGALALRARQEKKEPKMSLEAEDRKCAEGRTAPRVSLADIHASVAAQYSFTADHALEAMHCSAVPPLKLLTICILVLKNGFTVVGKSAPASPDNFDPALGAELAYDDCIRQIWPLMGFALREKLSAET